MPPVWYGMPFSTRLAFIAVARHSVAMLVADGGSAVTGPFRRDPEVAAEGQAARLLLRRADLLPGGPARWEGKCYQGSFSRRAYTLGAASCR